MSQEILEDNPEGTDETSPHLEIIQGFDDEKTAMQKLIQVRGRQGIFLSALVVGLLYANIYQLKQPKMIPYINTIDEHGQVVTTILHRPEEIPADNPYRVAAVRRTIKDWVKNTYRRSSDRDVTSDGLNSALRDTAGPGLVKLSTQLRAENIFERIEKEKVVVKIPKRPSWLGGNSWQAEWEQTVEKLNGEIVRKEIWSGTFELAQQDNWIGDQDAFGFKVVNWDVEQVKD